MFLLADLIYYSTYIVTIGLILICFFAARSAIRKGGDTATCSKRFVAAAVAAGMVSGVPVLYGVLWLLDSTSHRVNVGHGEALVAVPLLNFVIGLAGALIGRILLRWQTIRW